MAYTDPYPMSTTMLNNALQHLRLAAADREPITEEDPAVVPPSISVAIQPPGLISSPSPLTNSFSATFTPQELKMRVQRMFDVMTNTEKDAIPFENIISKLDGRELQKMASLLTSDSDYFLDIARHKNGSIRLNKLLGISDDVDTFFASAILRRFVHIMTDKYAKHVAIRGIRVFDKEKKEAMYEHILKYALELARDKHGSIVLKKIITDVVDDPKFRKQLFDTITHNGLFLSKDAYGNFVIQHLLKQNDLRCTHNIAAILRGHFVDLSFHRHGCYSVEQLLEAEESRIVVVEELLECEDSRLMRLARNEYGNFVVDKALRVTQKEIFMSDLFWGLVNKLMPFLELFRWSQYGRNIASILESISKLDPN